MADTETQLFNENERRIFSLLTKGDKTFMPIVLALDESQELNGSISAGFGRLGIEAIADENLYTVHRSTKDILALAFHVIQRTTDLFGTEFPDFTSRTISVVPEDHKHICKPVLMRNPENKAFGKYIIKQIRSLRKQDLRQIAVIVHSDRYWDEIYNEMSATDLPFVAIKRRGERINLDKPIVALSRPESIGGQEFDAVIAVGLEQGLVPPRVDDHLGLSATLEQKALREMYLSFTRARYQLRLINSHKSSPSALLKSAIDAKLLCVEPDDCIPK